MYLWFNNNLQHMFEKYNSQHYILCVPNKNKITYFLAFVKQCIKLLCGGDKNLNINNLEHDKDSFVNSDQMEP